MEQRWQVFISSTYVDLSDERKKVIETLIKMNCFPSGMEVFPAADEEQFNFIKKVIDDCDYYILIIGGRYGSVNPDTGQSYTEMEFDYAVQRGIKVIALLHKEPDQIVSGKTDNNDALRAKLALFREKAKTGRMIDFWKSADELPGLVAFGLMHAIKTYPARGWIRAPEKSQEDLVNEINELLRENERQRLEIEQFRTSIGTVQDIRAILDETTSIRWYYPFDRKANTPPAEGMPIWRTWLEIFKMIIPALLWFCTDTNIEMLFVKELLPYVGAAPNGFEKAGIMPGSIGIVRIRFEHMGLIKTDVRVNSNGWEEFVWSLAEKGVALAIELGLLSGN